MSWIKFNINDSVKVRLTDRGKEIVTKYWKGKYPEWFENYHEGNKYYRFQLHELIRIFGQEFIPGNKSLPFETEIFLSMEIEIPLWLKKLM